MKSTLKYIYGTCITKFNRKKYGQGDSYISKCMQGHVEANSQWGGRSLHAGRWHVIILPYAYR